MTKLPPYVYVFRPPDGGRTLYVGKASNIGYRLADHFRDRAPWALEAGSIELHPIPAARDANDPIVDHLEQRMIHDLRPRGNQKHNRRHHDALWMLRARQAHRKRMGERTPLVELVGVWWELAKLRARRVGWVLATHGAVFLAALLL